MFQCDIEVQVCQGLLHQHILEVGRYMTVVYVANMYLRSHAVKIHSHLLSISSIMICIKCRNE